MFKKLREKIIQENIFCQDLLKKNISQILSFYMKMCIDNQMDKALNLPGDGLQDNQPFIEDYINVSIVCDLYYEMRQNLMEDEQKVGSLLK